MLTYQRNLLKSRVNTVLGTLFLASWAFACCLLIWTFAHNDNPLATVFAKACTRIPAPPNRNA